MLRTVGLIVVLTLASGCMTASPYKKTEPATAAVAYRLASQIAAAASRLDVEAILPLIPKTDAVVYVSNGYPITGHEYRQEMNEFYASLKRLDWKWTKWEATTISDTAVTFTGWGTVTVIPLQGEQRIEKAVYTMLFVRENDGWKRVLAHKTRLP